VRAASGSCCAIGVPTKRATPWASRTLLALVSSCCILALQSSAAAAIIGINFLGLGTKSGTVYVRPLEPTEWAGVPGVRQANWNNAEGADNTTGLSLHDADGQAIGATVTWTFGEKAYTAVSDSTGDGCLMRGYLYRFSTLAPPSITVAGLGPSFTAHGYGVLVYFDGQNATGTPSDWITQYTLTAGGSTFGTVFGKDAAGVNFSGTFSEASGSTAGSATAGNYVRFDGLKTSAFTLTATPISGDGPINAIQIVSVPEPASLALLILGLTLPLAARLGRGRPRR